MRYKRDESFRYAFEPSISGAFHILMLNEQKVEMAEGELSILNLSPGGIRIQTQYKLPNPNNLFYKARNSFLFGESTSLSKGICPVGETRCRWVRVWIRTFIFRQRKGRRN